MSSCPKCQHQVDDDFGLVTCPSCHTTYLIELDGSVKIQNENGEEQILYGADSLKINENTPPKIDEPVAHEIDDLSDSSEEAIDVSPQSIDSHMSENYEDSLAEQQPQGDFDDNFTNSQQSVSNFDNLESLNSDESFDSVSGPKVAYAESEPQEASSDFSDVVEYGNSEESQAGGGSLRYNLLLSGIDSLDLRNDLKGALDDKRFLLNVDEILKEIDQGQLVIKNISPVKVSLIVNRIKSMPIQIKWEQYAIHQS